MLRLRSMGPVLALFLGMSAASSHAQVKLNVKHQEGSKFTLEHTSKTHQIMTVAGMDIETNADTTNLDSIKVGSKRGDGSLPVEHTLESIKLSIAFPGAEINFDSTDSAKQSVDNEMLKPIVDALKARVGSTYTIVVGKDGKVSAVEGVEQVLQKIEESSPEAAAQMKLGFNSDLLKRSATEELERFPDILLKPGDTWTKTEIQEIGGGQSLTYDRKYEYKGTVDKDGKKLDKVDYTTTSVKYAMDPNSGSPAKITASDLKPAEGTAGSLLFDREVGRVVESNDKMVIKGTMTLEVMGQTLDTTLDLTIEESSVIKNG